MMLAVLACAVVLAGCGNKNKPEDVTSGGAPATDVQGSGNFGDQGPSSANAGDGSAISAEELDENARRLESQLRPVFFAFDKYDLTQESRDTLTANAKLLRDNPEFNLWIEGHCDERGTNEYNLALGDRRARAARDFLVAAGVASNRMTVISYGEERPFALGHDESSWSQNRRAHFKVKGRGIGG
jgi:peptidoglycan-associated lipoprotein